MKPEERGAKSEKRASRGKERVAVVPSTPNVAPGDGGGWGGVACVAVENRSGAAVAAKVRAGVH